MIDRFINHMVNFLIEVRDLVEKPLHVPLTNAILDKWKSSQICPWCDGIGLVDKKGEAFSDHVG